MTRPGTVQVFSAVSAWVWACGVRRPLHTRVPVHPERRWRVGPGRPSQRPHGSWLGLTSGHLCSFVSLMHTETTSFHVSRESPSLVRPQSAHGCRCASPCPWSSRSVPTLCEVRAGFESELQTAVESVALAGRAPHRSVGWACVSGKTPRRSGVRAHRGALTAGVLSAGRRRRAAGRKKVQRRPPPRSKGSGTRSRRRQGRAKKRKGRTPKVAWPGQLASAARRGWAPAARGVPQGPLGPGILRGSARGLRPKGWARPPACRGVSPTVARGTGAAGVSREGGASMGVQARWPWRGVAT